jgi:DNA polymerase III subunit beta
MEISISKSDLLSALRLAKGIADRKSTMPMLGNVVLRTHGKTKLVVQATDLQVSLTAEVKSQNVKEGGIALSAQALHDLVANAPGEDIRIKRADNSWAEIKSGRASYRLAGVPDRDFPKLPDHREVASAPAGLGEMIARTLFSVCTDETRFHLSGVYLECDGTTARMVSTDGHRLTKIERPCDLPACKAIIPRKGAAEIAKLTAPHVGLHGGYLFASQDGTTIAVKLIDATFPAYAAVIPSGNANTVTVNRDRLTEALRRAQLMSSDTRGIKVMGIKGAIVIESANPDLGDTHEEVEADYTGKPIVIGFNGKYVVELLGQMTCDEVTIRLGGELDPGLFEGDDGYMGVVMPMRV